VPSLLRFGLVALVALTSGCVYEHVGRPPSAAQVARINAWAEDSGALTVDYAVQPIGGANQAPPLPVIDPISIASCDDRQVTFNTAAGGTSALPTPLIKAIRVPRGARQHAAVVGAEIGVVTGVAYSLLIGAMIAAFSSNNTCDHDCGTVAVTMLALPVGFGLAGGGIGYLVGGERVFRFEKP
jgi:hypothetical protein